MSRPTLWDNPPVDKDEYVRAARAVRDANSPSVSIGPRAALFMASPIGGGKRMLVSVAGAVRRTEIELRALDPPVADRAALEQHFLRPWSALAAYLEGLAASQMPWLRPRRAIRLLDDVPQDLDEDVDFCIAYGLDDAPDQDDAPDEGGFTDEGGLTEEGAAR